MRRYLLHWMYLLASALLCSGCVSKFQPSVEANVGIFADNTIAMLQSAELGRSRKLAVYTKDYYSGEGPEETQFLNEINDAELALRIMMRYSLKLVAISDTHESPKARVQAYAEYLDQADDEILATLQLDEAYYKDLIRQVGEQEKIMDALKKAQPIIDAFGRYMNQSLDNLEVASEILEDKIDGNIDFRYADLIRYQRTLEREKYAVLSALEQVYLSGKGNEEAYLRLKEGKTVVPIDAVPDSPMTREQRSTISEDLVNQLDFANRISEEIEPDLKLYRETKKELDRLYGALHEDIRKVRLLTLVWLRAHQKMASGIISPAEWFDISETPELLLKLGTKALLL